MPTVTRESLLLLLKERVTNPVSFREITSHLKLSPQERRACKRILRELVSDGELVRTRKGLYGPAEEMSLVTGYFEAHRDGYGFVVQEKPGERDFFIPARATLGAMDNDRVVVRVEDRRRREGRIVRILERSHTHVVGIFEAGRAGLFVRPKNRSISFDLYVSPKDRGKAQDGDRVIAEIISYPTDKRPAAGRISRVLEKPATARDEVESIVDEFNLPRRFPHAVLEEAKELYATVLPHASVPKGGRGGVPQRRKDLRGLPAVTIDGEGARDFDDAVSIAQTGEGYRLWVHIADVGHYVPWGSLIDGEARKRGTSIYFPDRVIPMLPKVLSEDLCSLKPKVERRAFTVEMDFDKSGERIRAGFYPSIISSDERMTYTAVKKIIVDRDRREREKYGFLLEEFDLMAELCTILKDRRLQKGSLDFDLPEPEVLLDIQGDPEAIIRAERNFAHMIIEEFMIAANEAVAERLEDSGVPSLYRIHEEPDPTKVEGIVKIISTLGILRTRKAVKPGDFSDLLKRIRGRPEEEIIHHMILRSLKQARYSAVNVGHFGLASASYTHFTSPIRRYPDLVVHRILREVLTKNGLSDKRRNELESLLPDIAFHSSRMERQADDAERTVLTALKAWFMKDKIGEEFEGKVISVTPYGLRVRLRDYYVEGFLHVSYMTDDFYRYDEEKLTLSGTHRKKSFTIGKELRVRVDRVDLEEREIVFGI